MEKLETDEKFNIYNSLDCNLNELSITTAEDDSSDVPVDTVENNSSGASVDTAEKISNDSNIENVSTAVVEYKEVEEPCVSLTIIGENRLTDAEVFIRRGIKYSIKAFFSAIVLTIMHMFM